MGLSPSEVDRQQLWPFAAAWVAYKQVHGVRESRKSGGELGEDDLARMGIEGF